MNKIFWKVITHNDATVMFQIVDLALLVKQDMTPKTGDPFGHAVSATFFQYGSSAEVSLFQQQLTVSGELLFFVSMHPEKRN